jgi:CTP:molybdopterin cytidylyltransferase MocA
MGTPKALLPLGGETFLERLIRIFSSCCQSVCVVLGHDPDTIRAGVPDGLPVEYVVNEQHSLGQLSSLQCGLKHAVNGSDAVLFCPVDVPAFEASTPRQMLDQYRPGIDLLVVPRYDGKHGHPILIGAALIPEFLDLPVTSQARELVHAQVARTRYVDVSDSGILKDVDDREAYLELLKTSHYA